MRTAFISSSGRAVLGQIAARAGAQHVDRVLLLRQAAHDQHPHARVAGLDVPQDVQAAAVGHVDVEQHEIPILFSQQIERLVAACGLADRVDGGICLQKLLESCPDDRMVVGNQYS